MKIFITTILLFFSINLLSQNISGTVQDKNGVLPFVAIYTIHNEVGITSDIDGNFLFSNLTLPDSIVFSYLGYEPKTIFVENYGILEVVMRVSEVQLEEIIVKTDKVFESEKVLIEEKKNDIGVSSLIGVKELSKKSISNVQDGLAKLSGISFNATNINVRSLGDRYNQITLNNATLPSNSIDKRNLNMSLIPTSIISNIKVNKTFSSDLYGTCAGGNVNISTTRYKDVLEYSFGIGLIPNKDFSPNSSVGVSVGKTFDKFNIFTTIGYDVSKFTKKGFIRQVNRQGVSKLDYNFKSSNLEHNLSGFNTINTNIKNFGLTLNTFIVNSRTQIDRYTEGTHFDYADNIITNRNTPINNFLLLEQLITKYSKDDFKILNTTTYSYVNSGEDDRSQFILLYDNTNYSFNNIDKFDNHRFWSYNINHNINNNIDVEFPIKNLKPKIGYSFDYSFNSFDYAQLYYDFRGLNESLTSVDPSNPIQYIDNDLTIENELMDQTSYITNDNLTNSVYVSLPIKFKKLTINTGVRGQYYNQSIKYRNQNQPVKVMDETYSKFSILPSLSLNYRTNKWVNRFSFSSTKINPRFRELTPYLYTEVFAGSKLVGNPELISSTAYNFDLSSEFYPTKGGLVALTLFGKIINNPIERINIATASGRLESYQNTDNAYVVGSEFDLKKTISKFTIDMNTTIMWSRILISDNNTSSVIVTNKNRPIQGSSSLLSNLDIFYNLNGFDIGAKYTFTGKRLVAAGVHGIGDLYQLPQHDLGFIIKYTKNKYGLKLTISNILNTPYKTIQNTDIGNVEIDYYRSGPLVKLGFTHKLI